MDLVAISTDVYNWLYTKLDGLHVPSDEKSRSAAGCFDIAMEHQVAVTILVKNELFGSAFALARCVFEAYIRGVWLKHCASDDQIKAYLKGKFDFTFQTLINDIEKLEGFNNGVLSDAKKNGCKLLNDLTHTGAQQVIRRNTDEYLQPNYHPDDVAIVVDFVNSFALLSGLEVSQMANESTGELQLEFLEKVKEYKLKICTPNKQMQSTTEVAFD